MAAAVTMPAPHLRPSPVPIAPNPPGARHLGSQSRGISVGEAGPGARKIPMQMQCDGCRKRNSRCAIDERVGKCYSCDFHKQDCVFTAAHGRKRSYDETQDGYGDSMAKSSPAILASHERRARSDGAVQTSSSLKKPMLQSPDADRPAEEPTTATQRPEESDCEERRVCRYMGSTTDFELSLCDSLPAELLPTLGNGMTKIRRFDAETYMEILSDQTPDANMAIWDELERLVHPHQQRLVDHYLNTVQGSFPILSRNDVANLKSKRTASDPTLVAAIYLMASKSNAYLTSPTIARLEDIASHLLQDAFARPRLSTIQAALIVAQIWSVASLSVLNMQLNAAAFDLGLYQDCSNWDISTAHKALRKRLAWALFAHDKWMAMSSGRPALVTMPNWTVQPLNADDFEVPLNPAVPTVELFTSYVHLSTILSSLLDTFYTLSSGKTNSTQQILAAAKPVQLQLKQWYSSLPMCLKMDASIIGAHEPEQQQQQPSQNHALGFLHLSYFSTEILLHRRIIRSFSISNLLNTSTSIVDSYTHLHDICRLAAKTRLISSLDFLNRLRPAHFHSAFWPVGSRTQFSMIGSFGMQLLATSPTTEEESFYIARLKEYRWTLGVCAASSSTLPPSPGSSVTTLASGSSNSQSYTQPRTTKYNSAARGPATKPRSNESIDVDHLGFSAAIQNLDLSIYLWQIAQKQALQHDGQERRRKPTVKEIVEEMKRYQESTVLAEGGHERSVDQQFAPNRQMTPVREEDEEEDDDEDDLDDDDGDDEDQPDRNLRQAAYAPATHQKSVTVIVPNNNRSNPSPKSRGLGIKVPRQNRSHSGSSSDSPLSAADADSDGSTSTPTSSTMNTSPVSASASADLSRPALGTSRS